MSAYSSILNEYILQNWSQNGDVFKPKNKLANKKTQSICYQEVYTQEVIKINFQGEDKCYQIETWDCKKEWSAPERINMWANRNKYWLFQTTTIIIFCGIYSIYKSRV